MRSWITDRWSKSYTNDAGERITPPSAQLKGNAKNLDPKFRTQAFGTGSRWRVGWREPDRDGKQKMRGKLFSTLSQAEAFQADLETSLRSGNYLDPSNAQRTFADVAEEWYRAKTGTVRGSTLGRYRRELDVWAFPQWANTPIGNIRRTEITDWIAELREGTAPRNYGDTKERPNGLGYSYVRSIVAITFGSVLRHAVHEGYIAKSPLEGVKIPRTDPSATPDDLIPLSWVELEAIFEGADAEGETIGALVRFLGSTGARIGEALALRVQHIDTETKRAHITRTVAQDEHGKRTENAVKNYEKRRVPVPKWAYEHIEPLIDGQPGNAYVFRSSTRGPLDANNIRSREWPRILAGAGLDELPITPHSLRHAFATLAIAAGSDVKTLQQILGHKSAKVTLDTYADFWPDRLDEVTKSMLEARKAALKGDDEGNEESPV